MGRNRIRAHRNSDDAAPRRNADRIAGVVRGRGSHGRDEDAGRHQEIARVRRDPRASFLVESGERWVDLRAVHLTGRVEFVSDEPAIRRIEEAINAKYAAFRPPSAGLPAATQQRYSDSVYLRFVAEGRILTWDNARIAGRHS